MLYVFYGPDSFSRHEAIQELKASLDRDGAMATNASVFAARATSPPEVIAACGAVGFFDEARLVVVEGLLALFERDGRRGRRGQEAASGGDEGLGEWGALVEFLPQMPDKTVLVLVDGYASAANAMLRAVEDAGKVREFRALHPRNELPAWVQERAKRIGLQIDARTAKVIAGLAGDQRRSTKEEYRDLWALANELDKLLAYSGGAAVSERDVEALTPVLREQKGYFLCDAILDGRAAAAVKLLRELLEQDDPAVLLSMIAGRYRRLAIARELLDRGEASAAVGRALNLQGFALEKMVNFAGHCPPERLREIYRRIVEADLEMKGGIGDSPGYDDGALALEVLVQELADRPPRGRAA